MFIRFISLQEKSNGKIVLPELVSIADFHSVAKAINRNESACYSHWLTIILPILKTHSLDLPQNLVWQTDLMKYIVHNKVSTLNELDLYYVVKNLCPGQTIATIKGHVRYIEANTKGSYHTLHEMCLKRLNDSNTVANGGNKKNYQSNLKKKRAEEIITIYKDEISNAL